MSIKGLTEGNIRRNPTAGMAYLGSINKGAKRTQEMLAKKQAGPDLDYFRVEVSERFSYIEPYLKKLYGEQPKEFPQVWVMGDTPEQAFESWREQRDMNGARIGLRCDGEQVQFWYDEKGERHSVEQIRNNEPRMCPGGGKDYGGCDTCKFVGRMNVMLVQLLLQYDILGYFSLRTTSPRDIQEINGSLNFVYDQLQAVRLQNPDSKMTLSKVVFRLGRTPSHGGWRSYTDKDGNTKTAEVVKAFLYLEPDATATKHIGHELALKSGVDSPMDELPPPVPAHAPQLEASAASQAAHTNGVPAADSDVAEGEWEEPGDNEEWVAVYANSLYVQKARNGKFQYVLKTRERNYILHEPDLLVAAGIDPARLKWNVDKFAVPFEPPLTLRVDANDNGILLSIERFDRQQSLS